MLLRAGALTESELLIGLNSQELAKAYTDNSPPIGAILVEHKAFARKWSGRHPAAERHSASPAANCAAPG